MTIFSRFFLGFAALALTLLPAAVQANPVRDFVNLDGFAEIDGDELWEDINSILARSDPAETVFLPTADIGAIPLGILAIEARETPLDRVRYRVLHGVSWIEGTPGGALTPVSYTEVTRFNLGPVIREELIESFGADNVAGPDDFGVGPHIAYRIVTQPLMGNAAIPIAAGRMEVGDDLAADAQCLGQSCMIGYSDFEEMAPWAEMESVQFAPDAAYEAVAFGVITPVAAADYLLGSVQTEPMDGLASQDQVPPMDVELIIDNGLGQDFGLEAIYRQGGFMDDSVAAIWERIVSFSFSDAEPIEIFQTVAYECARGPDFSEPGSFCP